MKKSILAVIFSILTLSNVMGQVTTITNTVTNTLGQVITASNNTVCPNQQLIVKYTINNTSTSQTFTINSLFTYTTNANPSAPVITTLYVGSGLSSTGQATVTVPSNYSGFYCVFSKISAGASPSTKQIIFVSSPSIVVNSSLICSGDTAILTASGATTYSWNTGTTTNSLSVAPASTTSYTVTGTDGNGCKNTVISTVTVNTTPTLTLSGNSPICAGQTSTLTVSGATTYSWNTSDNTSSIIVSPLNTTTFSVVGANGNCKDSTTITVNVNQLPNVIANADTAICIGNSVTLKATGNAQSYIWNNGITDGIPFNPSTTTVFVVTGTDINGCQKKDSVTVSVNQLPGVYANATNTAVCIGSSVTLNGGGAGSGASYVWSSGIVNGVAFTPTITATYTVTGTNNNTGCSNTDTIKIVVNICADITKTVNKISKMYPIPANDVLNIEVENLNDIENTVVKLYTLDGRQVSVVINTIVSNKLTVDVSSVLPGTYILEVSSASYRSSKTIIIAR